MNTPSTALGVIGAVVVLVLSIIRLVSDDRARKQKEKADTDADIDKASNATDLMRLFDRLRGK